jgi:hypothetical protein
MGFNSAFKGLTKYHVKILLGDFNKELVRENIFKQKMGVAVQSTVIIMALE